MKKNCEYGKSKYIFDAAAMGRTRTYYAPSSTLPLSGIEIRVRKLRDKRDQKYETKHITLAVGPEYATGRTFGEEEKN